MLTIDDIKEIVKSNPHYDESLYKPPGKGKSRGIFETVGGVDEQVQIMKEKEFEHFAIFFTREIEDGITIDDEDIPQVEFRLESQWFDEDWNPIERPPRDEDANTQ